MKESIEINNKGVEHFLNENLEKAEQEFLNALAKDKSNVSALNNLGLLFQYKGDYKKAANYFQEAIDILPKDTYYLNMANCLVFLEKYDEAEENYKTCLRLNSDNINAKISLARLYDVTNKPENATDIWKHLMQSSSKEFYKIELAKNYFSLGEYDNALNLLVTLKSANENATVYFYIGACHYSLKNLGMAETAFKKSLAIDPDNYKTRHYLAINYLSKNDYANALREFDFLIKMHPDNVKVKLDKAAVLLSLADLQHAKELIEEILRLDPMNEKAHQYLKLIEEEENK